MQPQFLVDLPVPDGHGIYTFPDDLHRAHQTHTQQLAARHRNHDHRVLEVTAPHTRVPYYIEARTPPTARSSPSNPITTTSPSRPRVPSSPAPDR